MAVSIVNFLSFLEENLWELGDYLEYFNTVSSAKIN